METGGRATPVHAAWFLTTLSQVAQCTRPQQLLPLEGVGPVSEQGGGSVLQRARRPKDDRPGPADPGG